MIICSHFQLERPQHNIIIVEYARARVPNLTCCPLYVEQFITLWQRQAGHNNLFLITSIYNNLYNILALTTIELARYSESIFNLSRYTGYNYNYAHSFFGKNFNPR